MAAIVMIVVIVVVGAAAYYAVGNSPTKSTSGGTVSTCQPVNSPFCKKQIVATQTHDLTLFTPFKAAQTQNPIPFTAQVPSSDGSPSSYTFFFGDGSNSTSTVPTVSHTYSTPGNYLVLLEATIGAKVHDNYQAIIAVSVTAGYSAASGGANPSVSGSILSNSSTATGASGVLLAGQAVSLSGAYTGAPTNPLFTLASPSIGVSSSPSGTTVAVSNSVAGPGGASATFTFGTPGQYVVSFVGYANGIGSFAGQKAYQNYSWSVIVTPSVLHGMLSGSGAATSPHPGLFINYFSAPGGASSLDPSIAYDTVSYEPILNTYEALIMFNGSTTGPSPSDYVPVLSTCVPGANSATCQAMYGSTLYDANTSAYTFPIDKAAQFYDPNTKAHWGVYPSDVMFSVLRTEGFSTQPGVGA
ncbi:MAG TPA: PKD domain-containing protein, partial [Thermoplasmata archaeon]|nr:PKD domain-containing protein [Thermoplasmata archaeon]